MPMRARLSAKERAAFIASLLAAVALTLTAAAGLSWQAFGPAARGW